MEFVILIWLGLPALLLTIDFIKYLITGKRLFNITGEALYNIAFIRLIELIVMVGFPVLYFAVFDVNVNDCCNDSATFSPDHKSTIHILIFICIIVYLYSSFRDNVSTPIIEVITNSILLLGFVLNGIIFVHIFKSLGIYTFIGSLPIGILLIFQLIANHNKIMETLSNSSINPNNNLEKMALRVLHQNIFLKMPILLIICFPIVFVVTSTLLLFGQKPDSIIRAFTDTYKHGFSELDHLCDNVQCGGHFLCSVAANGHQKVVKPLRYGERNGNKIICNRQLLVANAFEELIELKFPRTHQVIRHQYNKVGNTIHKHYNIFNNKIISDSIYILMKPLEVVFLLTLYTFDKKPENRIAIQYLNKSDRKDIIQKQLSSSQVFE